MASSQPLPGLAISMARRVRNVLELSGEDQGRSALQGEDLAALTSSSYCVH